VTIAAIFEPHALKVIAAELAGFINLVGKAFAILFFMLWIRWTIPRVRIDQVMHLCLKVLLPFALACVLLAAVQAAFTKAAPPREPVLRPAAAVGDDGNREVESETMRGRGGGSRKSRGATRPSGRIQHGSYQNEPVQRIFQGVLGV
jgi:hypothetical protein